MLLLKRRIMSLWIYRMKWKYCRELIENCSRRKRLREFSCRSKLLRWNVDCDRCWIVELSRKCRKLLLSKTIWESFGSYISFQSFSFSDLQFGALWSRFVHLLNETFGCKHFCRFGGKHVYPLLISMFLLLVVNMFGVFGSSFEIIIALQTWLINHLSEFFNSFFTF